MVHLTTHVRLGGLLAEAADGSHIAALRHLARLASRG